MGSRPCKPGTPGPQGETGPQGATGPQGETGPQGATGPQGISQYGYFYHTGSLTGSNQVTPGNHVPFNNNGPFTPPFTHSQTVNNTDINISEPGVYEVTFYVRSTSAFTVALFYQPTSSTAFQIGGGTYLAEDKDVTGQVIFTALSSGTLRLRNVGSNNINPPAFPSSMTQGAAANSGTNASLLIVKLT